MDILNSIISDSIDNDDDASLKNKNNTWSSSVEVGHVEEEEENEERSFIPVKRTTSSSILRKYIIYQPDLFCKDESASVKEQQNHILYYYSQKDIDMSTMTTPYHITSPTEEEQAIQFSGLCNAISNFTTLVSTIENTTTNNNNHIHHDNTTTIATIDPTEVYLSDNSILIYVRLFPFRKEKNHFDNGIMSVLQIQQDSQDDIIDCKSLRFILQKSMELFLLLHNVSPTKKNVFQKNKCIFTKYYNKIIDDINNNFFSSHNNTIHHLKAPLLSSSFHFLHSILQLTPPLTTQSLMEHNNDDRPKRFKTWLCSKLRLQRCIHELFQQLKQDDKNNQHNSNDNNNNNNSKSYSNEFMILGASLFYNHNLLESFFVSECLSCSTTLLREDDDGTIIADESTLLLLYRCMLASLGSKLNNSYTHEIHKTTTSDSSKKHKKYGQPDTTASTEKKIICRASSFDGSLHINGQYQFCNKKSDVRNHGNFCLFTSTSHDDGSTYFIWAPKIYNSFFTRIVFFFNDERNWNMMLYLKDSPAGDCCRYDGDFIPTSYFFEKVSTTINATMADALVLEDSLKANAVAGNSNFGSPLYGRIDEGTYIIVAIDRCMKRSVIMLPQEYILGNSKCIVNNEASERQRISLKNTTASVTLTPTDITNPLSGEGFQEFSLVKPSDTLRCTLAAILPKEIMLALDDTMNEIQLGITTCANDIANYSLQDEATSTLLRGSGGGICELCTLITLTQRSDKGSRSGEYRTVWICGRKLGSRELYVALDAAKYKTVRQVQYALSRIRTDLVHLPYS